MPQRDPARTVRRPLVWAAAAVGLVIVAAAALPRGFILRPPEPGGRAAPLAVPDPPPLAGYLALAIAVFLLGVWVSLHVMRFRAARLGGRRAPTPVWLQVAIVVAALLLPALVSDAGDLFGGRDEARPQASVRPPPSPAREDAPRSQALGVAVTALLGVVLAALVAAAAWLLWPERAPAPIAGDEGALAAHIEAGIDDLESIADPRAAVIACYARMETLAARVGIDRRVSDTPHELLARLLHAHRAAEPQLRQLTELFERARFSPHRIDEGMRRAALDALRALRARIAVDA